MEPMTSHELARKLLAMPDAKIIGLQVGQGGSEGDNEFLAEVFEAPIGYLKEPLGETRIWFDFGIWPTRLKYTVQQMRDNGWLTDA